MLPVRRALNLLWFCLMENADKDRREEIESAYGDAVLSWEARQIRPDGTPAWWTDDEDAAAGAMAVARSLGGRG